MRLVNKSFIHTNITLAQLQKLGEGASAATPAGAYYQRIEHHHLAEAIIHEFTLCQYQIRQSIINLSRGGVRCSMTFVRNDGIFLGAYNSHNQDMALTFYTGQQQPHGGLIVTNASRHKHSTGLDASVEAFEALRMMRQAEVIITGQGGAHWQKKMTTPECDHLLMEAGRRGLIARSRVFLVAAQLEKGESITWWSLLDAFAQVSQQTPALMRMESAWRFFELVAGCG